MLVPVINELADKHWHSVLQESLVALKSILSEIDPAAYDKALTVADREKQKNAQKYNGQTSEQRWDKFYQIAIKKTANLKLIKKDYVFDLSYDNA